MGFDIQLYNGSYATLADFSALIHGKTLAGRLPEVTALAVNQGGPGTSVKILGRRFNGATSVRFGQTPAAAFTVVDDSTIEANSPDLVGGAGHLGEHPGRHVGERRWRHIHGLPCAGRLRCQPFHGVTVGWDDRDRNGQQLHWSLRGCGPVRRGRGLSRWCRPPGWW